MLQFAVSSVGATISSALLFCPVLSVQSKRRRAESAPQHGAGSSTVIAGPAMSSAGVIFLVRLVGPLFSFYSMDPSTAFLDVFQDYTNLDETGEPPMTVVHKCQITFQNEGVWKGKTEAQRTFTEFNFQNPAQREVVISMLEKIRMCIVQ
jgi:hypothetical protein